MSVAIAIVIATVAGIPIAMAIDSECDRISLPALGFLYGTGLIYFVMLLPFAWSAARVTIAVLAITAAIAIWSFRRFHPRRLSQFALSGAPFDLLTLWTIAGYAPYATVARVWQWDFWMIWGIKGATFFESRGVDWHFLESRWNDFSHPDYPLLVPLNDAYAALLNGGWNDRWMGLSSVAFGVALIVIVRQLALREVSATAAAAVAFAVSAFALTAHVGMAEAPLIAFGGAGVLQLRRGMAFGEPAALRHAALLLGLSACTKNEGLALIAACAIAILFVRPRAIVALVPAIILPLPWMIISRAHGLPSDVLTGFFERAAGRMHEVGTLAMLLGRHFQDRWIWLAIVAGLIIAPATLRRSERLILIIAAIQLLFFAVVYLGTPLDMATHVATSWPRLPRQIGAPVIFVELLMLAKLAFSASEPLRTS